MSMRIEFLKPAPGYAYSEKMLGDLPDEVAGQLVQNGYAIPADGKEISDLPEDFPMRELLIKEGFATLKAIADNLDAVKGIEGIGKKTYEKIVEHINS